MESCMGHAEKMMFPIWLSIKNIIAWLWSFLGDYVHFWRFCFCPELINIIFEQLWQSHSFAQIKVRVSFWSQKKRPPFLDAFTTVAIIVRQRFYEPYQTKNWILLSISCLQLFHGRFRLGISICVEPSETGVIYYSLCQTLLTARSVHLNQTFHQIKMLLLLPSFHCNIVFSKHFL